MTVEQNQQYAKYVKMAWVIYYLLAVVVAALLVLFVARDNEERFFYGMMTLAAAYVLRPNQPFFDRQILKYTGVSRPADKE